jgi:trans-aconitate 2-methyltransferase
MSEKVSNQDKPASDKSWDASAYDARHSFVWKYGEEVLELLAPQPGERVLDLGCGTGHLTNQIAARGAQIVGLDKSPAMIERARTHYPELRFQIGDAADFEFSEPFDAVFSNAAIHWMKDQDAVAASIGSALKPGGRFVAEFGGKGNIKKLRTALHNALEAGRYSLNSEATRRYYASIGEYSTLLESHGFRVTYAAHIDRPTKLEGGESGLRKWLEVFADNELAAVPATERDELIHRVEQELKPDLFRDGSWFADYKRLRVVAIKELAQERE